MTKKLTFNSRKKAAKHNTTANPKDNSPDIEIPKHFKKKPTNYIKVKSSNTTKISVNDPNQEEDEKKPNSRNNTDNKPILLSNYSSSESDSE